VSIKIFTLTQLPLTSKILDFPTNNIGLAVVLILLLITFLANTIMTSIFNNRRREKFDQIEQLIKDGHNKMISTQKKEEMKKKHAEVSKKD